MGTELEVAKQNREAERKQRSAVDELLIRNARKSPEQIEAMTGIPADQAMERLGMLLRSRDWMTEKQEKRLLLIELGDLIEDVKGRLRDVSEQYYADTANVALRGYEQIGKRLDAQTAITEEEMAEITRVQAEVYIDTLRELVGMVVDYIAEVHPEMDLEMEATINSGFQKYLPEAYAKVRGRIRD